MTERTWQIDSFQEIGTHETDGKVDSVHFLLEIDHKTYVLGVATTNRLLQLQKHNEYHPPDQQLDTNLLVLRGVEELSDSDTIKDAITQIPYDQIQPYLEEQIDDEEDR